MHLPAEFAKRLWDVAEEIRASSALERSAYTARILGLIFLRYADHRLAKIERQLASKPRRSGRARKEEVHALGAIYVPEPARFRHLVERTHGHLGADINRAIAAIEAENEHLRGALPRNYEEIEPRILKKLMRLLATLPEDMEGDAFRQVYEHFLGNFGKAGSAHLTARSVARLLVEIVAPSHGRLYDPCCGVGGLLVESARFIAARGLDPSNEISLHGTEPILETVQMARMNLAVHGLSGDIRPGDAWFEQDRDRADDFDFVLANPPFNQVAVGKEQLRDDPRRFPFGIPTTSNANYLWLQLFYSALNRRGRAGFVMANSASDTRGSELDIRKQLIQSGAMEAVVALSANLLGWVKLPPTLWFLDKGKAKSRTRKSQVLFIDARHVYRRVSRSQRDLTPEQVEYLANIVRLYRGEKPETAHGSSKLLEESFPGGKYDDVPGLCKVATLEEVEAQGWSLNPGRYVGVAAANAMRLRHMRLSNVYGFQDLDLSFPEGQVAVLVGANGAGKTTVLDSISMFLAPLAALLRRTDPRKTPYGLTRAAIHVDAESAEAKLSVRAGGAEETWRLSAGLTTVRSGIDPVMTQWARRLEEALTASETTPVPVLVYYPAVRFYLYEGYQKRRAKPADLAFPQLAAYENAFEMGQQSFEGVIGWFRREEDLENEMRLGGTPEYVSPRLHGVRQAVLRFMDRLSEGAFDDLRVRRDQEDTARARLVLRKGGKELSLDSLSDGERGCILLVADLAQRLAAANPGASDPLSGPGVVLIDELELHLHPRWQRSVLPALTETFRGCQFIVTTHSPQVLSRVPREQILLISRFQVVEHLPYTEGRDPSAILSELMGVPRRPEDATAAIDELARLIDDEDFTAARRKLTELERRFGPDDQDLLRLGAMLRALEEDEP